MYRNNNNNKYKLLLKSTLNLPKKPSLGNQLENPAFWYDSDSDLSADWGLACYLSMATWLPGGIMP